MFVSVRNYDVCRCFAVSITGFLVALSITKSSFLINLLPLIIGFISFWRVDAPHHILLLNAENRDACKLVWMRYVRVPTFLEQRANHRWTAKDVTQKNAAACAGVHSD